MRRWLWLLTFAVTVAGAPLFAATDPTSAPPAAASSQPPPSANSAGTRPVPSKPAAPQKTPPAQAAHPLWHQPKHLATGFIEHLVDSVLELFDVDETSTALAHYGISAFFLIMTVLLSRALTAFLFRRIRKFATRTKTNLYERLLPAMESPAKALIAIIGIFCALDALQLSDTARNYIAIAATGALSLVFFWGLLCALSAVLDHLHDVARAKNMGVAAFMPWIKKTAFVLFVIFGLLMVAQSLGANVKAFLAGLGIGGLAFALAAQDTLANLFGSIVVAIDQPFKIGEAVQIGSTSGTVEDIGLRSTKLRTADTSLVVMPNKTVASETISNQSRFLQRRTEQIISLTYDTSPEKMSLIVEEIRRLILAEDEVDPTSVMVYFRDFSNSSLDLWMVYATKSADFQKSMKLRERINLAIMRAVAAQGLAFAYPTRTVVFEGPTAQNLAPPKT